MADARLIAALDGRIPPDLAVLAPSAAVTSALVAAGWPASTCGLDALPATGAPAIALLDDEIAAAGEHAEGLLARCAGGLSHGGLLIVAAPNRIAARVTGRGLPGRSFSAAELVRAVGHPGLVVEHVAAPGAAAALRGDRDGPADPVLDAQEGLRDAAPRTLVVGRWSADPAQRTTSFFASVPRKIVAAAVLCRDAEGRLLVVHDSFRGHWTIPGGVVDADEDPATGARREAYEEAGVRCRVDRLLGVFAASQPDRLTFVYAATPLGEGEAVPAPVHTHEVDDAAWLPPDRALALLSPTIRRQVDRCLDAPGGTWTL